jgi:hypothetical protein
LRQDEEIGEKIGAGEHCWQLLYKFFPSRYRKENINAGKE